MSGRRRVAVGCVLLACALLLATCEAPPQATTLRVGVFSTQDVLPLLVIRELGLDRKHGLALVETTLPGGVAAIDAVATGKLDLCPIVGLVPLLAAATAGVVPEKAVAVAVNNRADPEHPVVGILAASAVRDWQDLAGRKIGVNAPISISTAAIDVRLKQLGVAGYEFVDIAFPNMGLAVAGGNVAAAAMNEPHLTQSLVRGDGRLLGWVVGGPPLERADFTAVVVSAELLRRQPAAVKAYLHAHLAAVRWINDHPGEARALLARRLDLSAEVAKRVRLALWPRDARMDPVLLEDMQRTLLGAGLLERPVDVRQLYDERLLAEVLRERR